MRGRESVKSLGRHVPQRNHIFLATCTTKKKNDPSPGVQTGQN